MFLDYIVNTKVIEHTQQYPRRHSPTNLDVFQEPDGCRVMGAKSKEGGEIRADVILD